LAALDSTSRIKREINAREADDRAKKNEEREKKSMKARRKWQNHLPTGELRDELMSPPASQ
jgi:hypothetical protein